jgi:hypothetical protein
MLLDKRLKKINDKSNFVKGLNEPLSHDKREQTESLLNDKRGLNERRLNASTRFGVKAGTLRLDYAKHLEKQIEPVLI